MGSTTKGDGQLKQVLVSLVVIMLAAGIFAGMVLHTVSVMRQAQLQILTGEFVPAKDAKNEKLIPVAME